MNMKIKTEILEAIMVELNSYQRDHQECTDYDIIDCVKQDTFQVHEIVNEYQENNCIVTLLHDMNNLDTLLREYFENSLWMIRAQA